MASLRAVEKWSCRDVGIWLKKNGFKDYVEIFTKVHKIDGQTLLDLNENDLRLPPLQIQTLGDLKRMWRAINELRNNETEKQLASHFRTPTPICVNGYPRNRSFELEDSEDGGSDVWLSDETSDKSHFVNRLSSVSETWRTVLSFLYATTVFLITSFVMTVVHDRVPDMKKYPPLPDIVLDNVPLIPWAFTMCEVTGVVLGSILAVVLFFHKHRMILFRRLCALTGTVFLLRCITMFSTALSVPGVHLECSGKLYGNIWTRLCRAFEIFFGLGMSVNGVRTCGDYMFSGHTVSVTLLNFFITEYTPRSMYYLHTICWVLNMFGIFFILAAHEHYSIDVFIAFYISSRLFLYYHTLANTRALKRGDRARTRVWFPLFWFFEEKVDGKLPNEYEWPLSWSQFAISWHKVKSVWLQVNVCKVKE